MCDFVAGTYTATWKGIALGQTKPDEGFRYSSQMHGEDVKGDAMGQTAQDSIHLGREDFVSFTLIEYLKGTASQIMNPWSTSPGRLGAIGHLAVCGDAAKPLILTAVTGTSASSSPASRTIPLSILAPGFPVDILFAPKLREIPIRLKCFPAQNGAFFDFFTDA